MKLRALTWNINGLEEKRIGPRMEKLCLEILVGGDLRGAIEGKPMPPVPEVLMFQEMTRRAQTGQMNQHLRAAGFSLWPKQPPNDREDYALIAVRPPWKLTTCEWRPFTDSPLRRGCLVATIEGPEGCVTVITGHMESLRSGRLARLAQAREIDMWMHQSELPALYAGDTNLRQGEWVEVKKDFRGVDAFEVAGAPKHACATWWPEGGYPGYRFDRFWLSEGWHVQKIATRKAGNASDHAGVEVLLTR